MPRRRHKNKKYSPELKIALVEAYLSGKGSMKELAKKYELLHIFLQYETLPEAASLYDSYGVSRCRIIKMVPACTETISTKYLFVFSLST